ncbi:PKD domain-containing protein [Cryomorpha ignava]|uniref:PKD domain-containing protein n=1 Tax=Cryomorpha ignava TaxID=101383 RepID=A0A7K3WNP8_9FLAO|nr:T9SS-dependent M36 family metallopeptidase [Cryomorpha ignava]NEN22631.1 PKD domain-containing protein [Cryomorpha ignava]
MKKLLPALGVALICALSFTANAQNNKISAIQKYLIEENPDLKQADIQNLEITNQFESGKNKLSHVYASQAINGIRISNSSLSATFDSDGKLRYVASRLFQDLSPVASSPSISLQQAITSQLENEIPGVSVSISPKGTHKADLLIEGTSFEHNGKSELVYFMTPEKELKLAWSFDCELPNRKHWYHYFVDAIDGKLLQKIDWQTSCKIEHMAGSSTAAHNHSSHVEAALPFSPLDGSGYRVFELPIESPNHGERTLAFQPADILASPFGWHDINGVDGAEYTITRGNNVYAYEDQNDANSPGASPDGGADLLFDYTYDDGQLPENYVNAATTNLFYLNNRIHDVLFNYGFDEAAGNFQASNYTNEGLGNDFVNAECQDGEDFNNANMATPPEGTNPRMQMYLWQSGQIQDLFMVNAPGDLAGDYTTSSFSSFGPQVPAGGITEDIALFLDADGTSTGCTPSVNGLELEGKIAILRRGGCNFADKVLEAQAAGAVACIIVNNAGGITNPGGFEPGVEIPSFMILQSAGEAIITALEDNIVVNATISGVEGDNFIDGSFDNGVVVHEYVHGLSIRLTGGSSTSNCLGNEEQMGEGWSDWYAIMLTMNLDADNPVYRPMGTFAADQAVDGNGIRPVPYDTSFAVNDYTYADLGNNEISVPHGVGFVWSTMLWDLSWAFMDEYGYDPDLVSGAGGNNIALQLITDGLKLQTCSPGFVDGRDAILMADELTNDGANKCLIWKAFAKRGLGFSAEQGSSESRTDGTAAFDLPPACFNITSAPTAAFSIANAATCNGIVQFTDESLDLPQAWAWDFGDGGTSSNQNPTHVYDNEGVYSVSLTVTNTLGEDVLLQSDIVNFSTPQAPTATGASGCAGQVVSLSANGEDGTILWTDADGNEAGQGESIEVTLGNQSQTYFAQVELDPQEPSFAGPVNENFGSGGNHATTFVGTVQFTTLQPLTINTVYVNSGGTGTRVISVWEGTADTGELIDQILVDVDFTGPGTIALDLELEIPGSYSIGLNQANLYRNDSGVNYPYTTPGLISITGSSAGPDFYYYFYHFEVEPLQCLSEATDVLAEVTGGALIETEAIELTVSFTANGSATSWAWDFGDGNTSDEQNPVHIYNEPGVYTVTLITNGGCESVETIELIISGVEDYNSGSISIHPNPASDLVNIKNDGAENPARATIRDIQGRVILEKDLESGFEWQFNTAQLPTGMYALWISDAAGVPLHRQKLMIVH